MSKPGPAPQAAHDAVAAVWLEILREQHPGIAWKIVSPGCEPKEEEDR